VTGRSATACARYELVDLPCFGRPARLVWRKQRWWCRETACPAGSWTQVDGRIAAPRAALTDRAARWATVQVGRHGRAVRLILAWGDRRRPPSISHPLTSRSQIQDHVNLPYEATSDEELFIALTEQADTAYAEEV